MIRAAKWVSVAATAAVMLSVAGCGNTTSTPNTGSNTANNTAASSGPVTINETGSSLLYPLFNGQWISAFKSVDSNVTMTAASTGSGTGISQAIAGTVQIGASDAYLSDMVMSQNSTMLNIPLAISAQQVMYNLPGLAGNKHLNLSGDVLAQMYMGKITNWNDPKIAALNPGVSLPNHAITLTHRSDGSGDTFLFTSFLSATNSDWKTQYHYSTTISWPSVQGEVGAKGNDGIVTALASNPYSVGYVGISWLDRATAKGLGYAALQNQAGKFVLPTSDTISAAAAAVTNIPADERVSLIYASGDKSYPIVNFEYAIVNSKQSGDMATALKKFLNWAIDPNGGNASQYMTPVHFLPLPSNVEPLSQAQINKIGG